MVQNLVLWHVLQSGETISDSCFAVRDTGLSVFLDQLFLAIQHKEVDKMDPNWWMYGGYMVEQDRLREEEEGEYVEPEGSSVVGWVIAGIIFFVLILLFR